MSPIKLGTVYRAPDGEAWIPVCLADHAQTAQVLVIVRHAATGRHTCGSIAWFESTITLKVDGVIETIPHFEPAAEA